MAKSLGNPHIRTSVSPCGSVPGAVDVHTVESAGAKATLLLDARNVGLYGPELFHENRCPLLAGFRQGRVSVLRPGVSWGGDAAYAKSYGLADLATRVGLPLGVVEGMLVKEGLAWAESKRAKRNPMRVSSNPPPWATRLMRKHWAKLEDAVGRADMPSAPGAEEYGCGHYGCVWPTASGKVVKITSDETEARFVAAALSLGEIRGMTRYYKILQLGGSKHRGRNVYVIWRAEAWEVGKLTPPWDDPYGIREVEAAYSHLRAFQLHAAKIRDYLKGRQKRRGDAFLVSQQAFEMHGTEPSWTRGWHVLEERVESAYRSRKLKFNGAASSHLKGAEKIAAHIAGLFLLTEEMSTSVRHMTDIGDALAHCLREGILLADVHGGNIGKIEIYPEDYPGELSWGITDPGHAVFLTKRWAGLTVPLI